MTQEEFYVVFELQDLMKLFASTLGVLIELFTVPVLSEQMEMETAAENLLGAKGFLNSIVTITNGKVDVLVNKKDLSKVERSQIEDIVVRKVGCQLGDVVISSIKTEE